MGYTNLPINAMNTFEKFILKELNARHNDYFALAEKLYNNGITPTPCDIIATTYNGMFFMIEAKSTTKDYITITDRFIRQMNDIHTRWLKNPMYHRGVFLFAFMNDPDQITLNDDIYAIFVPQLKYIIDTINQQSETESYNNLYNKLKKAGLTKNRIKKEFFENTNLPEFMEDIEFNIVIISLFEGKRGTVHANFNVLIEANPLYIEQIKDPLEAGLLVKRTLKPSKRKKKRKAIDITKL